MKYTIPEGYAIRLLADAVRHASGKGEDALCLQRNPCRLCFRSGQF